MSKIIAVDLDGTLLNSNKKCSQETKNYLKGLKKQDYIIVIATGRILNSAKGAIEEGDFVNYIVSDAGATIYNNDTGKIEKQSIISKEYIEKILSMFDDNWEKMAICDHDYYNIYSMENYPYQKYDKKIEGKEKFLQECNNITHMNISLKDFSKVQQLKNGLSKLVPELNFTIMQDSFSDRQWLEIFNKGVSKYDAIKEIAQIKRIPNKDIICFGDGLNDVDMIKRSGVGVSMGNALPQVKESADFVTLSNDENGVEFFLEGYLK